MKSRKLVKSTIYLVLFIAFIWANIALSAEEPKILGAFFIKGKVGVNWQLADGASQYYIYRKTVDSEYQKIGESDKNHYFDTEIQPGGVYTYKVAALVGGAEKFSNEKSVTIPGGGGFNPPEGLEGRVERNSILLRWGSVKGAMAYNIYRSTVSGSDYEIVGNAQAAKFSDKEGLERGGSYHYVVTALNAEFEETEYSIEVTFKYGMSAEEKAAIEAEENKVELNDLSLTNLFTISGYGDDEKLNFPADVYTSSDGNIYIADGRNPLVHCYDNNGKFLFSFGTFSGEDGISPGRFIRPFALFIDDKDQIYVSDVERHDIQIFDKNGGFIKQIKPTMKAGLEEFRPSSFHVLKDGRIVATDLSNERVLILSQDGAILKVIGSGNRGSGDGDFNQPDGVTVVNESIICVVDVLNFRVQEFDLEGNFIRSFGYAGKEPGAFGRPKEIAIDGNGWIWVSDAMSNMLSGFTPEGDIQSIIGSAKDNIDISVPRGMFFSKDRVYIVSRSANKIEVFKIGI